MTRGKRVFLAGATGTIGRATAQALAEAGHAVTCLVRPDADTSGLPQMAEVRRAEVTDAASLARDGFRGDPFDAVISCLASRTGVADDAWAIDHGANATLLKAAQAAGVGRFVLLSAICVQKPHLAFQHAKLAFEAELQASGLDWTIIRPTAFFKSLSGQIARVKAGKPYLVFGSGTGTACTPISDRDLGRFIAGAMTDPAAANAILPIGGPHPAITPLEQAHHLFELLGEPPRIRHVPLALMDVIVAATTAASWVVPRMKAKAELARIGRYYATESMLVWDADTAAYDAEATPAYGADTLFDHYAELVRGEARTERGAHSVFEAG